MVGKYRFEWEGKQQTSIASKVCHDLLAKSHSNMEQKESFGSKLDEEMRLGRIILFPMKQLKKAPFAAFKPSYL